MKPEPLRVASPRFTRKVLMLRWLCDTSCMLNSCLSSPVMRCEPTNYCRWVKAKNRNSVLYACARESFFAVSPPLLLASAWVSNVVGAMGGKLPDKSKKCPRLESFAPPFFGRNGVVRASAGAARRLCRFVTRLGPPRFPLASRAPARFGRCAVGGRTKQQMPRVTAANASGFSVCFCHFAGASPSFCVLFF